MKISRHITIFAGSGILAALSFQGLLLFGPEKGQHDIPLWRNLVLLACLAMLVIGLGGLLASFCSWIIADVEARRKAKADLSPSTH